MHFFKEDRNVVFCETWSLAEHQVSHFDRPTGTIQCPHTLMVFCTFLELKRTKPVQSKALESRTGHSLIMGLRGLVGRPSQALDQ